MYKNILIIILVFLLCSLLFQNKSNINILMGNVADTKDKIVNGAEYVKETFDDNFSEKEFEIDIDIPYLHPKEEPLSEGSGIKEETFFNEEVK